MPAKIRGANTVHAGLNCCLVVLRALSFSDCLFVVYSSFRWYPCTFQLLVRPCAKRVYGYRIQIHVDDDVFVSGRLGSLAMWSVDPWQLLAQTHPARTEWTSHLVGLGMGVRQLTALATAVESAVGLEAVGRMQVVISCHEGQVEAVVRDLAARKMCR